MNNNNTTIKAGQVITFKVPGLEGQLFTRKVQQVCTQLWNPEYVSYNVEPVGCGTALQNVNSWDVVRVK